MVENGEAMLSGCEGLVRFSALAAMPLTRPYVGRPPDQFAQRWHGIVSLSANHKSPCCLSQTGIRGHESHSDIARHSVCRRNALPLRSTIVERQV